MRNDDLSYSFLLGFYDGEGHEGTTRIYSTNFNLLYQIKNTYTLNSEVREVPAEDIPDDLKKYPIDRTKPMYDLALGAELLNKMMDSYLDSLTRKRKIFSEQQNAMEVLKYKVKDKSNLIELIEEYGKEKVTKEMGVAFQTLDKLCKEWNITATKLIGLERLKKYVDKETLIKMIEDFGIDNTAKKLNAGSRTVKSLMKDWGN